jgi:cysteine desulfurase / selenocysteine lyase
LSAAADAAADFSAIRAREFPRLGQAIHLNSASYAPLPQCALDAARAFDDRRAAALLHPDDFGAVLDRTRAAAARLVNAEPAGIALVPNTSVGLNIAASIARQRAERAERRPPRTIVVPDGEFPANMYCWLALERHGFRVERVPTGASVRPDEDRLAERVSRGDVAVLAISAVQFVSGYTADLQRLGVACREAGVLFVVDAIQAAGVSPLDVQDCDVDVLATGGHKWLCGPFGTGFVYLHERLVREHEADLPGWLAFQSSMDFERLLTYAWDPFDDARRFEVGSLPMQGFVALAESLELLLRLGIDRIREHVHALHAPLLEFAAERQGVEPLVPETEKLAGILSLRVPDAPALHASMVRAGIHTVTREGAVRFAPHFFNTDDEVGRVIEHLRDFLD